MNRGEEDYIKAVYELTVEQDHLLVPTNDLALKFGFTDQSVNEMVKRLVKKGLFTFSRYKGVSLTSEGKKEATRMIRSHRLWELFLYQTLGFKWHEVHEDAERLEHVASEKVIDAIDVFLKHPTQCQHGNPIPSKEGVVTPVSQISLFDLSIGDTFSVVRVKDNKDLLIYLNNIHLQLGDIFTVTHKDDFVGTITVSNSLREIILTQAIAHLIYIDKK